MCNIGLIRTDNDKYKFYVITSHGGGAPYLAAGNLQYWAPVELARKTQYYRALDSVREYIFCQFSENVLFVAFYQVEYLKYVPQ